MRSPQASRGKLFDKQKLEFVSRRIVMESETRGEEMPTEEEMLSREDENIRIEDQGGIISFLTAMNDNMKAMSDSLKRFHVPTLGSAETAKKRRRSAGSRATNSSIDSMALTNQAPDSGEDSDCEALLTRPNYKHVIDEDNRLSDEIAKQLEGEEETCGALPDKLTGIIEKRWHVKLTPNKLTEKQEKYLNPVNFKKLAAPRINKTIWPKLSRDVTS